jgi:RNA polymerase sigma factor (sigma-70 family)
LASQVNPIEVEKLIEGCMKGRLKDQEGLYKHFYGYAMGICLRYAKTRDEASEILNDSFLKVFNKLGMYDSSKLFKAWLRRIVVNTAIDYYRREHKYDNQVPIEKAGREENDFDVIDQLNTEDILKLLQKLPDNHRVVFNLYEIEGYSHDEIGEMLQIPVGTSKSNLSRAKQKLRTLVTEHLSAKAM